MEAKVNGNGVIEHEVADFSPRDRRALPPSPKGFIERLEKLLAIVTRWTTVVGGIALIAMLILTLADVIGNKVFNDPIAGTSEFVGYMAVVLISFAMGLSVVEKAHVQVDIFTGKLPARWKYSVEALVAILGLGLFAVLAYFSVVYGNRLRADKEVSMTQHIPFYPFVYSIAFACLPVCLYLLLEFLRLVKEAAGR